MRLPIRGLGLQWQVHPVRRRRCGYFEEIHSTPAERRLERALRSDHFEITNLRKRRRNPADEKLSARSIFVSKPDAGEIVGFHTCLLTTLAIGHRAWNLVSETDDFV